MKPAQMKILRVFSLVMLLALVGGLLAPGVTNAQAPAAQGSLPFYPRQLTEFRGISSSGPFVNMLPLSGDWAPITIAGLACGHCGTYIRTIELHNVLTGQVATVHSAHHLTVSGDGTTGAQGVQFADPWLVWRQPVSPMPGPGQGQYIPGDFTCTLCAYNVRTGQGGPAQPLVQLEQTSGGSVTPVAMDPSRPGRVLAVAGNEQAGTLWTVHLETGETQQVPGALLTDGRVLEAVLHGGVIAWTQRVGPDSTGLFLYYNNQLRQLQARQGISNIQTTGSELFWWDDRLERLILNTGELEVVPGASLDYKVAGNRVAWTLRLRLEDRTTLIVADLADPSKALLQAYLTEEPGPQRRAQASLGAFSGDRLLYYVYEADGNGFPQRYVYQMTWLLPPDPAFARVWERADGPVARGQASRTWLWGPQPFYLGQEGYADSPNGRRQVQYFDKSRMEVNNPNGNANDPFYVSNGLLVAEMIGGDIRMGNETIITSSVPVTIPVAGDPRKDNPLTPGYSALRGVASLHGENQAPDRRGQPVNDAIDVNGVVGVDAAHGALARYATFVPQTGHNIPDIFWAYLNGMQGTYGFDWTFVLGYPITEGYWTQMRVGGRDYPVLIQAYQRRVLTYAPDFPAEWRLQQGNVGQHYFEWRFLLNAPRR